MLMRGLASTGLDVVDIGVTPMLDRFCDTETAGTIVGCTKDKHGTPQAMRVETWHGMGRPLFVIGTTAGPWIYDPERGTATRSKKNPGKRAHKGG